MDITQADAANFDKALRVNAGANYQKFLAFGKSWAASELKMKATRKALGIKLDGHYVPAAGHCPQYPLWLAPTAANIDAKYKATKDAKVQA